MKNTFIIIASVVLFHFCATTSVEAQSHSVTLNGEDSWQFITGSHEMTVIQQDERRATLVANSEVVPQAKSNAIVHTLNVYPPTDGTWLDIWVSDGTRLLAHLSSGQADFLTMELEEGVYHVLSFGNLMVDGNRYDCHWVHEDIYLNSDMDVQIDYADCIYDLNLNASDENGNPLSGTELEFITVEYDVVFLWQNASTSIRSLIRHESFPVKVPYVRFNGFTESTRISLNACAYPKDQQCTYFISTPDIIGLNNSFYFSINAEDMSVVHTVFADDGDLNPLYYHLDVLTIGDENGYWEIKGAFNNQLLFESSLPYTVVSNSRIGEPSNFDTGSKYNFIINRFNGPPMGPPPFSCVTSTMYISGNGELVREALPLFYGMMPWYLGTINPVSWPNMLPETPAMIVGQSGETVFFGERTPLAIYYPISYRADNNPYNTSFFSGGFFFSGENNCVRSCDYDSFIRVYSGGQEIYNWELFDFNRTNSFEPNDPDIVVEVDNTHLFMNGVSKNNQTRVKFNLDRDDAIPPTMTFLRVLNGDGDEAIWHSYLPQSTLVFGCADFSHYFSYDFYDYIKLVYEGKPNVDVLYSVGDGEWHPLEIAENEELFHENYGNVFVADLSQLESRALNKWVSLKFMLEDAAGNTQEQTLENVFYSGHTISVDEYAAERLEHEVIPNPFTEEVRIKSAQPLDGVARVQLYDVLGRRMYDATENGHAVNEFIIDGSALKPGIYFYDINTEKGVMRGKIVKN